MPDSLMMPPLISKLMPSSVHLVLHPWLWVVYYKRPHTLYFSKLTLPSQKCLSVIPFKLGPQFAGHMFKFLFHTCPKEDPVLQRLWTKPNLLICENVLPSSSPDVLGVQVDWQHWSPDAELAVWPNLDCIFASWASCCRVQGSASLRGRMCPV